MSIVLQCVVYIVRYMIDSPPQINIPAPANQLTQVLAGLRHTFVGMLVWVDTLGCLEDVCGCINTP